MKTVMTKTLVAATLMTTILATNASSASAQEQVPQDQVSSINGQLVPVGEHNEYKYDFPRWNVSTNPLGLVLGSYGLSVSYGFHQNIALRGDLNYWDPVYNDDDVSTTGVEIGVGAPIYLRRTYQGAFVEPGFIVRHATTEFTDSTGTDKDSSTTFGPQVLLGWHWTWDSGLNIAAAAGIGRNYSTNDTASSSDDNELFVNGYLRVGYAF